MRFKQVVAPVLLVGLFAAILIRLPMAIAARAGDYDFLDPIIDVRHHLMERFVEEPDEQKMLLAAIAAMIETLEDPYTVYIPPADTREFNKDMRGEYVGIGAEVNIIDDYLTIISPMDDSPALEAGVMAGDVVLEIEGQSTYRMPISESIEKLMGEPETPVTIRVRHVDGTEETITIVRRHIVTRTVRGLRRLGEAWTNCVDKAQGVFYVRVTQFNQSTILELREALEGLLGNGLRGLVLDLRDNPGGELTAAVEMCDLFLESGTIVEVRDRSQKGATSTAEPEGTLPDFPVIVLVNGFSASASEIVAGALQENHRARVLGSRTHGKGSVQEVRDLELGRGTLKLTAAYYYLPSGRTIHRRPGNAVWGVDPDILMPVTDEAYVDQARARREFEIIRGANGEVLDCHDAAWIRANLKDEQLARAAEILGTVIGGGPWPQSTNAEDSSRVAIEQDLERYLEVRNRRTADLERIDERIAELEALLQGAPAESAEPPTDSAPDQ